MMSILKSTPVSPKYHQKSIIKLNQQKLFKNIDPLIVLDIDRDVKTQEELNVINQIKPVDLQPFVKKLVDLRAQRKQLKSQQSRITTANNTSRCSLFRTNNNLLDEVKRKDINERSQSSFIIRNIREIRKLNYSQSQQSFKNRKLEPRISTLSLNQTQLLKNKSNQILAQQRRKDISKSFSTELKQFRQNLNQTQNSVQLPKKLDLINQQVLDIANNRLHNVLATKSKIYSPKRNQKLRILLKNLKDAETSFNNGPDMKNISLQTSTKELITPKYINRAI
ncbi:UNKNOWN [Stylonychia lemnae]|uniref:Uncharacterized protein n=1 Tax=Stylonychia lemnae TaxID=5949 RepID=A0A077ZPU3_STYLE|nr:UNKNOWN [Stylonychia lemnae]|eukprot:CDW71977.1 UNKNOWN [Stylonychia lemnae]